MAIYSICAVTSFGMESITAQELKALGFDGLRIDNGKVIFSGDEEAIVRCNIWLRTADRILIRVKEFMATDFEELFQGILSIDWGDILPHDSIMHVTGKSVRSRLFSIKDCQSVAKKAIVEAMKRRYHSSIFPETGPLYKIEVALYKDMATINIDTSGPGLHKRGYRQDKGEAPLRETLAAGIVMLSRWSPAHVLSDPFCGSGTIPIEAALIGKNMAPGLKRSFVSERWWQINRKIWKEAREDAQSKINNNNFRILASDIDERVLKTARQNALRAGVSDFISFQRLDFHSFQSKKDSGYIICNPPYGERMGDIKQIEEIYKRLGALYSRLENWSLFVLSPHPDFQRLFGRQADRNRKIYNGKIKCYLYQYLKKQRENG
ncbi:MAG TPA: class I SAM-dependent RNA methyltransferase [Syntrophorhabdaceae bacterium]|nr:class I SAM-dependent RNA methyltransferase [Syntrophorhabdaceae bacterium]HPC66278.1 class I SAM-dependent RNA methyltransferase [Syntrophorhabdaceae bacterium]HQE80341.1 class I SAM-dependent RNA methyltransferase [Syntrophorhabdaceae bacterium]HQH42167.1 class I SAM-dependent RNA methyltransferase [Syntrophorhabdaceae bacterium]HQK45337.1 class I SAM-dependent RNA methyltransferase [Syntrophorhabdaceae bacterium]